jgi:hypothetical protein
MRYSVTGRSGCSLCRLGSQLDAILWSNSDKTEVLWVSMTKQQHQLPVSLMLIDGSLVHPARTVRNLRVFIDAHLVIRTHVNWAVAQCFAVLRQIHRSLSPSTLQTLVAALVLSRLDYANSTGRSTSTLDEMSPVGAQCSSPFDIRTTAIRPCL